MPPKAKYTKVQIIDEAYKIVREKGESALSARTLAKALGISTGPIFALFNSIADIRNEVVKRAKALYADYINEGLKQEIPFKGAGLKYVQFAKDEPELFHLLFMQGNGTQTVTHFLPAYDDNTPMVLEMVEKTYHLENEKAKHIYNHMSVYTHGFAVLFAQGINIFTMDDVSRMMTEMFTALLK